MMGVESGRRVTRKGIPSKLRRGDTSEEGRGGASKDLMKEMVRRVMWWMGPPDAEVPSKVLTLTGVGSRMVESWKRDTREGSMKECVAPVSIKAGVGDSCLGCIQTGMMIWFELSD